jgi:deferrochelatase/peroxidase EfeB
MTEHTVATPAPEAASPGGLGRHAARAGRAATAGVSRRTLLRRGLLVGAGAVGGGVIGGLAGPARAGSTNPAHAQEPFYGSHQSGIVTDTQQHTVLASFDLTSHSTADLEALLRAWTSLAAELAAGASNTVPIYTSQNASDSNAYADATGASTTDDSLEAYQLGAQRLTITVGFGRSLFVDAHGADRMGLASRLPASLVDLPHFAGEQLIDSDSGGDLFLQACADDQQVAFHAVRSIARIAPDVASLRWTQLGYSPTNDAGTPRNLMGFKDGTIDSNVHPPANLASTVWAGSEGPDWMIGGSYLVYRRIRITLEHWDRLAPPMQEQVVGRQKLSGAPLGASSEFDALDLTARDASGNDVIPQTAHVRLAAPASNGGATILRRAFSYNNGTTPFTERWPPWRQALEYDVGLLFLAYQTDPRRGFIPINQTLTENDAMNQFTTHTASAVFAVPPAVRGPGDWFGRALLT